MASLLSISAGCIPTTCTSRSHPPPPPSFSKYSSCSTHRRFKVSCNSSSDDHHHNPKQEQQLILPNVDRRNMLLGLGAGLYGAANVGSALAYPITAPDDISHCVNATEDVTDPTNSLRGVACCPPPSSLPTPEPYVLPKYRAIRVRQAAQRVTPEYIKKYQTAISEMKKLPDEDPHSWKQQGKIHCAYCNGAYSQEMNGHPELKLQVHGSSLFFPFHRWYLYFYERILGNLIDDPYFALPYWNWDNPTGMMLPAMFEAPFVGANGRPDPRSNPLFDPYRSTAHLPPALIDLQFKGKESGFSCVDQMSSNLSTIYGEMVSSTTGNTEAFFGTNPNPDPLINSKGGKVESGSHTSAHIWTGNPRMANSEDMGNFYSAGYDPVFYAHHANVDRLWKVWRDLGPKTNLDPVDDDWLNASFVFYDENKRLVRVYNRDCVDIRRMGYDFEPSRIPWVQSRPVARVKDSKVAAQAEGLVEKAEDIKFPLKLDNIVKVLVKRPGGRKRSDDEKKSVNEMLFLNGIKYNGSQFFKLDVLVNDVDDGIETTAASSEFAGTFSQAAHGDGSENMFMTSGTEFGITELLEDVGSEDDNYVLVTLVPAAGAEGATVAEINIQLVPIAHEN